MLCLLMNTCGAEGIVALARDEEVLAEVRLPSRGTSEGLMPAVRQVLGTVRVGELAAIGVVVGPGSFTGVRVGLAAAKGLCEAGGVGMVGMSRLGLVAGAAEGEVNVFLDGGRGEFFWGLYGAGGCVTERLIDGAEALENLELRESLTCEARVGEALVGVRVVEEPGAAAMLATVRRRVAAEDWSNVALIDATYLRRTDAEVKLGHSIGSRASGVPGEVS